MVMTKPSRVRVSEFLKPLLLLQEIDQEIEAILDREKEWPLRRNAIAQRKTEILNRIQDLERLRKDKLLERDRLNLEVQEETQRALTYERHLKEVKTNREYQALMHELSLSKKARQEVEEVLLKVLEELEGIEKELTTEREALEKVEEELRLFEEEAARELTQLGKERGELERKRKEIVAQIAPPLLSRYQFIRKRYANVIAYATDCTCSGCQRKLPPQMYILVLKEEEVMNCPSCQRFLLPPEDLPQKEQNPSASPPARAHSHP